MVNRNHKILESELSYNSSICKKCNKEFLDIYGIANVLTILDKSIPKRFYRETGIEYINRVNPCLTDEEALIKKLLE